jgi:hypothetical protein
VAYFPQGNGIVERVNKTLQDVTAKALDEFKSDLWDEKLPGTIFAYNTIPHGETDASPYELFFGRLPRLPCSFMDEIDTGIPTDERFSTLQRIFRKTAVRMQELRRDQRFKVGDQVLVHRPAIAPGWPKKFALPWKGPFKISGTRGYMRYAILDEGGREMVVHAAQLKPYFDWPTMTDGRHVQQQHPAAANPEDTAPVCRPTYSACRPNPPALTEQPLSRGETVAEPLRRHHDTTPQQALDEEPRVRQTN